MYKINQQHKYGIAKTMCVIVWKDRRIKQVLLISAVFANIGINQFTDKHFTLYSILVWIHFYKSDHVFITLPLPELRKVAENCQKQLVLIINPLPYKEIHSHCL